MGCPFGKHKETPLEDYRIAAVLRQYSISVLGLGHGTFGGNTQRVTMVNDDEDDDHSSIDRVEFPFTGMVPIISRTIPFR